ncbi:MAG: hypothetical protein E7211_20655 [Clostridium lundense]|nr:hypothetical protein [Clostridium lundense]
MQITRWTDETETDIQEVERKLLAVHNDEQSDISTGYANWVIKKQFNKNKTEIFNGKNIEYNLFTFSVDQIPVGLEIDDDSVTKRTGFIIPYELNGKVRYIIDRNSGAMTLIRKMLFYTGKGEVVKNNLPFTADKFVWLISKVYGGENVLEGGSDFLENLTINTIRGFKGDTEDSLTTISAEGESVMNIISTLSFLIESKNLNQINMDLAYRTHTNIGVTLNNKNTVFVSDDRYIGELIQDNTHYELVAKIILILYTEIIPIIIQNYQNDVDSNLWNQERCIEFLQKVANDLSVKVASRIEDLKARPEQLNLKLA